MTSLKKIQVEKITSKNTKRTLRDKNANKTTVLLSHLKNNYAFIVGYCCSIQIFCTAASPTDSSYPQYSFALIKTWDVTRGLSQGEAKLKGGHWLTLRKIVEKQ